MTIYKEYGIRKHWKHWSAWLLSPNKKKAKLGQIFFLSFRRNFNYSNYSSVADRQPVWRGRKRVTRGTKTMVHTRERTSRWRVTNPGLNICRSGETRRFFSYSSFFFLANHQTSTFFVMLCLCACVEFAAWATTRTQWLLCGIKPHPYEIKNANQDERRKHWMTLRVARKFCNCCKSVRESACLSCHVLSSLLLYMPVCLRVCVCLRLPKTWQLHAAACAPAPEEPHLGGRATKIFKSLLHWFSLAFSFCPNENGSFGCCCFFFNFCGILGFHVVFFFLLFLFSRLHDLT